MKPKTSKSLLYVAIAASVLLSAGAYTFFRHLSRQGDERLKVEVLPVAMVEGWGYEIKVDGKTFIRQETIPAVPGGKHFVSREDALKTGNAVMKKLLKGTLPSLTPEEVKNLGIAIAP
jgi:hypothetical protein